MYPKICDPPWNKHSPWKWMVGILSRFLLEWPLFSGVNLLLVSGSVPTSKPPIGWVCLHPGGWNLLLHQPRYLYASIDFTAPQSLPDLGRRKPRRKRESRPCRYSNEGLRMKGWNNLGIWGTLQGTNISLPVKHFWVDDFPFPKVGYVSSLEGTSRKTSRFAAPRNMPFDPKGNESSYKHWCSGEIC